MNSYRYQDGVFKILSNLVSNSLSRYTDEELLALKTGGDLLKTKYITFDMSCLYEEFGVYSADIEISECKYNALDEKYSLLGIDLNSVYSSNLLKTLDYSTKKIHLDVILHVDFSFILYALFLMEEFSKPLKIYVDDLDFIANSEYKITSKMLLPSERFLINISDIIIDSIRDEDISKLSFSQLNKLSNVVLNLDIDKKEVKIDTKEIVDGFATPIYISHYINLLEINGRLGEKNILIPIHMGLKSEKNYHIMNDLIENLYRINNKDDEHIWIVLDSDGVTSDDLLSTSAIYNLFNDNISSLDNQNFHFCLLSYSGNNLFLTDKHMMKLKEMLDNTLFIRRYSDLKDYLK